MRFDVEVHWNPDGLLEGEVRPSGAATATPFWGITELIGLLQTKLGPTWSGGSTPGSPGGQAGTPGAGGAAGATGHNGASGKAADPDQN